MDLADRVGMVFDRRLGTVVAVKDLRDRCAALGSTDLRSTDPTRFGLTACSVVYTLDLIEISRHIGILSL